MTRLDLIRTPRSLELLDPWVERHQSTRQAFSEPEVLCEFWNQGEEIRLHEDERFRRSRWGGYFLRNQRLANEAIVRAILQGWDGKDLDGRLLQLDACEGGHHVVDSSDPRLHRVDVSGRWVLADLPLQLEEACPPEIPNAEVLTITAAAGRFGAGEAVDSRGHVRLHQAPQSDCFIVQAQGRSMEPTIPHGSYLLVQPGPASEGVVVAYHPDFVDDLGSCVVKRWINGKLDSDHPQYRGRPLLPEAGQWQDVRIVGRLVRVLEPADFVGLKTFPSIANVSPVDSPQHRQDCLEELQKQRDKLLAAHGPPGSPEAATSAAAQSQLALSADGLQLRLLTPPIPLSGDIVHVAGVRTPVGNLQRPRVWSVPPQTTPYLLKQSQQSDKILTAGLAGECASLFRFPIKGVGRRLHSQNLRAGESYRCMIPPTLSDSLPALPSWATPLSSLSGWAVLDVESPDQLDAADQSWLDQLGLEWQPQNLRLALETAPRAFRDLESGQSVPHLDPQDPLIVSVWRQGASPVGLLMVSASGTDQQELRFAEDELCQRLQLQDYQEGLLVIQAQCGSEASAPLAIWIESSDWQPNVLLKNQLRIRQHGQQVKNHSCLDLIEAWPTMEWELAPLWEVHMDAGGPSAQQVKLWADEEGRLNLSATLGPLEKQWKQHWFGSLRVVCPALDDWRLLHQRPPSDEELADSLRRLAESHEAIDLLEFEELSDRWQQFVKPVLETLGYRWLTDLEGSQPIILRCSCPGGDPLRIHEEDTALFLLSSADTLDELQSQAEGMRQHLKSRRLPRGFMSNGRYWLYVDRSSRRVPKDFDLLKALEDDALLHFCRQFGAEA